MGLNDVAFFPGAGMGVYDKAGLKLIGDIDPNDVAQGVSFTF